MATVVDALIVTLGLDPAGMQKGTALAVRAQTDLQKVVEASGKKVEETEKKLSQAQIVRAKEMTERTKTMTLGLSKLRNEALGLLAVFTAGMGLKAFTTNTIAGAAALGRQAENLGMTTERLQAYKRAAEMAGGSQEGMASLLSNMSMMIEFKNWDEMDDRLVKFLQWGAEFGASFEDMKDVPSLIDGISRALAGLYQRSPTEARAKAATMGIDEATFNLLKHGPDKFHALIDAQEKHSVISKETAKRFEELTQKGYEVRNSLESIGREILVDMQPQLNWLAGKVVEISKGFEGWTRTGTLPWLDEIRLKVSDFFDNPWVQAFIKLNSPENNPLIDSEVRNMKEEMQAEEDSRNKPAQAQSSESWWERLRNRAIRTRRQSPIEKAEIARAAPLFDALEERYNLPKGLLDSVWAQESGRGRNMNSGAGAQGHFQFMPGTAKQYGLDNPYDLVESADAAARMYRDLLRQNDGDLTRSLAGYNWGMGNLRKKGLGKAPLETRNYIEQVTARMSNANRYGTGATSTSTTDVKIGTINIETKATDAAGIAKTIGPAIQKYGYVGQANSGQQ